MGESTVLAGGRQTALVSFVFTVALFPAIARAWIYPEHRDIAVVAIGKLSTLDAEVLQRLWDEGRQGYPGKLCEKLSEGDQGLKPACIDFAAFAALSGDHSCSPQQVLTQVLTSDWILKVARVSAETKAALAAAKTREAKLNESATNNLKLQVVDPEYATRAGANNAHFLLPRTSNVLTTYVQSCLIEGAPLNALGLYGQYHVAALALAQQHAVAPSPGLDGAQEARQVLALEGFALHFLEDIYSSGHDVGTWGTAAWRKGTHDYYSEFGIDAVDWNGRSIIAFGDSNMKPADLERASNAVAASLHQLARALSPGDVLGQAAQRFGPGAQAMLTFDSCKEIGQPTAKTAENLGPYFADQVGAMPIPALGRGEVHAPRFRDELGLFVGAFGSLSGGVTWGSVTGTAATGTVSAGLRVGVGADSLTGLVGTGIAFLEVGISGATEQKNSCGTAPGCAALGTAALYPAVPSRTGLVLGLRLPFWIIPGDLLILGPVLALTSMDDLTKVGVAAASGGLIPYERSFRTGVGIFQVILGREAQATFYGGVSELLSVVPIGNYPDGSLEYGVVQFKSVDLDFPVIEWTPFRTFETQLTFAAALQLGFGLGIPTSTEVLAPAGYNGFEAGTAWSIYLRGIFDARYFLGSREDLNPSQ
jgi:hypothetical protein